MGAQENEKAIRYISQLNDARSNDRWQDVPELARKVDKHAPHRSCLTTTARAEAKVATHDSQRPSTDASTASKNLSSVIPSLLAVIESEQQYKQDAFQAKVCLAWLHWTLGEPGLAVAQLRGDLSIEVSQLSGSQELNSYTQACVVRGAYLKGYSQEKIGSIQEAIQTYNSILPYLASLPSLSATSSQFRLWTERLLTRLCLLSDQSLSSGALVEPSDALHAFQMWSKLWDSSSSQSGAPVDGISRRMVWKAYYDTLSRILRRGLRYAHASSGPTVELIYPTEGVVDPASVNSSLKQRAELKKVETIYESLLLQETAFPKANQWNEEIEEWVDAVIHNWRILCGPSWTEEELGEGGKNAVARNVLEILYRAATRTYHSTKILRHLFIVHASLAEFELAFKAFDAYVEIVTRGKDRTEKSGEEDEGLDDDDTVLRTAAEAVRILCKFGDCAEAEKAFEVGRKIEQFLRQHTLANSHQTAGTTGPESPSCGTQREDAVSPRARGLAYRAIGTSRAQWADFTYDVVQRGALQREAIKFLRKSLEPEYEDASNLEVHYTLGMVLAKTRDVPGAIKVIKHALFNAEANESITTDGVMSGDGSMTPLLSGQYIRERKQIPLLHLLAKLLSARRDFEDAAKSCDAAFDQFPNANILFGEDDGSGNYRSEHLNTSEDTEKPLNASASGLVDRMDIYEKEGIVQLKMTQLALVEQLEGSNTAVDESDDLFALYTRLFGNAETRRSKPQMPVTVSALQRSSTGKGSIFGRRRASKAATEKTSIVPTGSRPSTSHTAGAPTIQVTDGESSPEKSDKRDHSHHHLPFHHRDPSEKQATQRRTGSLKLKKKSAGSLRNSTVEVQQMDGANVADPAAFADGVNRKASVKSSTSRRRTLSASTKKAGNLGPSLPPIAHNMPNKEQPPPAGHQQQPPKQDVRLPAPFPSMSLPEPRFPVLQERRHKVSLLVSIWIFMSGLYARAVLYEDAKGALDEAAELIASLEAELAQGASSTTSLASRGWGGGKSIEELWGDVWAARGELAIQQQSPHEALAAFEKALARMPDHPVAVVGLSEILLDIYSKKIPAEPIEPVIPDAPNPPTVPLVSKPEAGKHSQYLKSHAPSVENTASPAELNRLAARDRAYGLLSTLTKLGTGWDSPDAWMSLGRAYEESGQKEKQLDVLWWVVELADTEPLRPWSGSGVGGYIP